jgi:cytochrome c biogenesis protein CcdA
MLQAPEALLTGLDGSGLFIALGAALLLGVRHATDPDHLTTISTLVVSEPNQGARRAARLGLAWGTGHALTLLVLGLPVVVLQRALPEWAGHAAESLAGVVIIALALRLLLRWRRGCFHAHQHRHHGPQHIHLQAHDHRTDRHAAEPHTHRHASGARTAREALGIGLLHGAGGSGLAGAMLVGTAGGPGRAALALAIFAAGTAISMGLASGGVGLLLERPARSRAFQQLVPLVGLGSLAFGAWYAASAVRAMSVPFGAS